MPVYSPNGNKILYNSNVAEGTELGDIFIMDSDGSKKINLTNTPDIDEFGASYFPNGEEIVFARLEDTDNPETSELYKATISGDSLENVERLTNNNEFEIQPQVGPKGNYIVYATVDLSNGFDLSTSKIYRMDSDKSNKELLHDSTDRNDWCPYWLPLEWE